MMELETVLVVRVSLTPVVDNSSTISSPKDGITIGSSRPGESDVGSVCSRASVLVQISL